MFNEGPGIDSRQNEEAHYRKHAVIGREWGHGMSISDYRAKAMEHLNSLISDEVIELCQADDVAVVKFNLSTGELGVARRDDGTIKTFFRPSDVHYVMRKVGKGLWGSPDIVEGFYTASSATGLAQDPEQRYLLERLEALSLEVPAQAHGVIVAFLDGAPSGSDLMSLLARLSECRFAAFELRRRVLTVEQEDFAFGLRKKIAVANASLEALERHRGQLCVETLEQGLDASIGSQMALWPEAMEVVSDHDMFETALDEREAVGFSMMELRILHFSGRLRDLHLDTWEHRVRKSDIYLRKYYYALAQRFAYRESHLVSPEDFFWRRMARV